MPRHPKFASLYRRFRYNSVPSIGIITYTIYCNFAGPKKYFVIAGFVISGFHCTSYPAGARRIMPADSLLRPTKVSDDPDYAWPRISDVNPRWLLCDKSE